MIGLEAAHAEGQSSSDWLGRHSIKAEALSFDEIMKCGVPIKLVHPLLACLKSLVLVQKGHTFDDYPNLIFMILSHVDLPSAQIQVKFTWSMILSSCKILNLKLPSKLLLESMQFLLVFYVCAIKGVWRRKLGLNSSMFNLELRETLQFLVVVTTVLSFHFNLMLYTSWWSLVAGHDTYFFLRFHIFTTRQSYSSCLKKF